MLVLTRRRGEKIVIGDADKPIAVIEVVGFNKQRSAVQIAVQADKDVQVDRGEIAKAKAEAMKGGAGS